ncbi:ATP-dependent RNA helicase [Stagonosporopsis vannaccii]|nr:ATP-dependent RNA helicase [Stagonosporopsis vannaccii]
MPRPARAKIQSKTSTTTRVTKPNARKVAAPATTKSSTKQTRKATAALQSFSDDSDGLVTNTRSTRAKRDAPPQTSPDVVDEADLEMSGALPAENNPPATVSKPRTPAAKAATSTRATRGSARLSARGTSPAVAQGQGSPNGTASHAPLEEGDTSGFGDLTFSSLNSESPAHGTRPPSAVKVGATPAHETSILALTNFKRRARQPSLLRMVQQTTDVEDNDDSGLSNTDNFDFDDFLPQDESTPLNKQRLTTEKEGANDSGAHLSSSGSRGRKRKLTPVVQVPRSSPPYDPPSGADVESARSPSPSLPDVLPSREEVVEQTQDDPEILSQTLAPPKSSSPVREIPQPTASPQQARASRRGRSGKRTTYNEDSEAEDTETPAKEKRNTKAKAQQHISTAQLKGLLPRRRNRIRAHDEYDFTSSEDVTQFDSDQDELQMPARRARQRLGVGKTISPKATKKARGKKATSLPRASRTYSRRISSDKENDEAAEDVEETPGRSAVEISDKLAAIRKKFEEIDDFELEFGTVDTVTSSSPYR